ncbi:MAG: protein-ADP-ribose hydrolase, partial [Firmicutes bacterium]|nr:protein-ADP-ribose hydrolase [Bacillota bacterium]
MNQKERRIWLIRRLLQENPSCRSLPVPKDESGQRRLLRSLMNIRMPGWPEEEFLQVQDAYLQEEVKNRGIVKLSDIRILRNGIRLWRGDITTLACDAIVNAANSGMTGCYQPCHSCIDNCIHTFAGVQLRARCAEIMNAQRYAEPTGQAKITPAYNLPCDSVIHTVGPIVQGPLTRQHCDQLASCYRSCLQLADQNGIGSIAFCCISTGVFCFPNQKTAEIA